MGVDINAPHATQITGRDHAPIAIPVELDARQPVAPNPLGQCPCRFLSTIVNLPGPLTRLPAFRCVDTMEADSYTPYFQAIAIHNTGGTDYLSSISGRIENEQSAQGQDPCEQMTVYDEVQFLIVIGLSRLMP